MSAGRQATPFQNFRMYTYQALRRDLVLHNACNLGSPHFKLNGQMFVIPRLKVTAQGGFASRTKCRHPKSIPTTLQVEISIVYISARITNWHGPPTIPLTPTLHYHSLPVIEPLCAIPQKKKKSPKAPHKYK